MENTFTNRVLKVIDTLITRQIVPSDRQFAFLINIDPTQLSLSRSGKRTFPEKYIYIIAEKFGVSKQYLQKGEGDMFTNENKNEESRTQLAHNVDKSTQQVKKLSNLSDYEKNIPFSYARNEASPVEKDVIQVPIVEKRARAGYVQGFADPEYMESLRKVYVAKQYEKGNYLVFEIDGNSMDDDSKRSICNGDALLCKELDKEYWKNKLFYSRYLFIIVTNEEVLCKQIINHDVDTGKIVCHSFNPAYEDFELNLSEVNQLFYLVRIVERNIEF